MKAYEIRALARESLKGKWIKGFVLTIIYCIISFLLSMVLNLIPLIGAIAFFIISPALSFGFLVSLIKLSRGENPTYFEFLKNSFKFLGKLWGIIFHTVLKMFLPIFIITAGIFTMISGFNGNTLFALLGLLTYFIGLIYLIIKTFYYTLTSFILYEEPTLSAKDIVNKSEILMKGNVWRQFCLNLSFLGWAILSVITFGIAYFFVMPYMQIALLKFYEDLDGDTTNYDNLAE